MVDTHSDNMTDLHTGSTTDMHTGSTTDLHSDNMTLLQNLPKRDAATQSELAFQGNYAYAGTFSGVRVIDISRPGQAKEVSFTPCNGGQCDVSVWGNLLFASVDTPQTNDTCAAQDTTASAPDAWEGLRIFDITDPTVPRYITSIRTDCGSHTHTLVPIDGQLYIYVSSFALRADKIGPHCRQCHGKISVIKVDTKRPWLSTVVAEPKLDVPVFDHSRLEIDHLLPLLDTKGCHDITVFVPLKLAAAACLSIGQLWDISDPLQPRVIHNFTTPQVKMWQSAAFTWDGRRLAFTQEAGGGAISRCRAEDYPDRGAIWIYDVRSGAELGHYKLPRFHAEKGCTMKGASFVPGLERDIVVCSAYGGATTVADVTDPANPEEIGWYQAADPPAFTFSSYWHNGFIYANDITRGFDVFSLEHPSLKGAALLDRDNPQTQEQPWYRE